MYHNITDNTYQSATETAAILILQYDYRITNPTNKQVQDLIKSEKIDTDWAETIIQNYNY